MFICDYSSNQSPTYVTSQSVSTFIGVNFHHILQ